MREFIALIGPAFEKSDTQRANSSCFVVKEITGTLHLFDTEVNPYLVQVSMRNSLSQLRGSMKLKRGLNNYQDCNRPDFLSSPRPRYRICKVSSPLERSGEMSAFDQLNYLHINGAIRESAAICVLVFVIGVLSGCGGYRAPTGGTMPGQTPRTYPMQHPTDGSTGRVPIGSGLVL